MENPASWNEIEKQLIDEIGEYRRGEAEGVIGHSMARVLYNRVVEPALRAALDEQAAELRAAKEGTCLHASTGRGDCENYIGLPGRVEEVTHDGPNTEDAYGKPNGWCWRCWDGYRLMKAEAQLHELSPPPSDPGKTHWPTCWKARGHQECAVERIAELEAEKRHRIELEKLVYELEDGDELGVEQAKERLAALDSTREPKP